MARKCVICGNEFEPHSSIQVRCSAECTKQYRRQYNREYNRSDRYRNREKGKYRKRTKESTLCKICGKPTAYNEWTHGRKRLHERCVLEQCIPKLKNGEKLTDAEELRLRSFGYSIRELRQEIASGER